MTTTYACTALWWWWLLFVALSWAFFEGALLVRAHVTGQRHIVDWTLFSDTIRRWSMPRPWLAPLVVGTSCGLLWHFFAMSNPA